MEDRIHERVLVCELACQRHETHIVGLTSRLSKLSDHQKICCGMDGTGGLVKELEKDMDVTQTRLTEHSKRIRDVEFSVGRGYAIAGTIAAAASLVFNLLAKLL